MVLGKDYQLTITLPARDALASRFTGEPSCPRAAGEAVLLLIGRHHVTSWIKFLSLATDSNGYRSNSRPLLAAAQHRRSWAIADGNKLISADLSVPAAESCSPYDRDSAPATQVLRAN